MAWSRPETVQELIDLLKLFPPDHGLGFQGLTLFQLKDRGDIVNFEFNELEGDTGRLMNPPRQ